MLSKLQQRQLKEINNELGARGMDVGSASTMESKYLKSVTVSVDRNDKKLVHQWRDYIHAALDDIDKFRIENAALYMTTVLREMGIPGASICGPRDEFDIQFGTFVSRARLLKHIKKTEAQK